MIDLPIAALDAMDPTAANEWFQAQVENAKWVAVGPARKLHEAWKYGSEAQQVAATVQFKAEMDALEQALADISDQQRRYFQQRKAREKAAQRAQEAVQIATNRKAAPPQVARRPAVTTAQRRARFYPDCYTDGHPGRLQQAAKNGWNGVAGLPETVCESPAQKAANDARRARETSTIHIDTHNVEYRLKSRKGTR